MKYLSRGFKAKTKVIKDDQGIGIAKVWRDYSVQLFQDIPYVASVDHIEDLEPVILSEDCKTKIHQDPME